MPTLMGLKLNPSSLEGLSGLAQSYSAMGRNDDAERLLKQVLTADPQRANDALVLGDLYLRSGNYDSALDALNRAERSHPDARSELLIAICYEHEKKLDRRTSILKLPRSTPLAIRSAALNGWIFSPSRQISRGHCGPEVNSKSEA